MEIKRLSLVTDAWDPQTSGVVTTLTKLYSELTNNRGYEIQVIHPGLFNTFPCPTYPNIQLAYPSRGEVTNLLQEFDPDYVHIPVEGPIGLQARRACKKLGWRFTTSYTTKWPEYVYERSGLPVGISYTVLKRFHRRASRVSVATPSLKAELKKYGFRKLRYWGRGVDTDLFKPREQTGCIDMEDGQIELARPICMYMGRVSVEKNLRDFLDLGIPGSMVVIGDGPDKELLEEEYREVEFLGEMKGQMLANALAQADVFVFPSLTDTFGIVMIEAMACGVPVAAYPVTGPRDIIVNGENGYIDEDLEIAIDTALQCSRKKCRKSALGYSWERSFDQFEKLLIKKVKKP